MAFPRSKTKVALCFFQEFVGVLETEETLICLSVLRFVFGFGPLCGSNNALNSCFPIGYGTLRRFAVRWSGFMWTLDLPKIYVKALKGVVFTAFNRCLEVGDAVSAVGGTEKNGERSAIVKERNDKWIRGTWYV